MKKNLCLADSIIRVILAAVIIVLYFLNFFRGTLDLVMALVAIVLLATAFISFCPIYALLGIRTRKQEQK